MLFRSLLNHKNNYDGLSTLCHEMGHAMHSFYSNAAQPYPKADYTIFVAEVASTTNEILLNEYLRKQYKDDPAAQRALVGNLLENAIEAVQRVQDAAVPRAVRLKFARSRDVFFITCQNTADPATVKRRGDVFFSSKRQGQPGFGIPSIQSTARTGGGNCSFTLEGCWFTTSIELVYN